MNDERILKKVGKLLSMYGVNEEEKNKFLLDLKDKKYDDQEEVEEVAEDEQVNEEKVIEEPTEEKVEDVKEEKVDDVEEQPEQPVEEPVEEQPMEEQPVEQVEPQVDYDAKFKEYEDTINGLVARIESLEDVVKKLGVSEPEEGFGEKPENEGASSLKESSFDTYNRKRIGQ